MGDEFRFQISAFGVFISVNNGIMPTRWVA